MCNGYGADRRIYTRKYLLLNGSRKSIWAAFDDESDNTKQKPTVDKFQRVDFPLSILAYMDYIWNKPEVLKRVTITAKRYLHSIEVFERAEQLL